MKLIAIAGATASGKTAYAIQLAKRYEAEIISCDARQFYRELNICTAKPTREEQAAAKHHFIDNLSIHDSYTVGDYEREVLAFLADYFQRKEVAILVGGSGLFYRAVCEGTLDALPDIEAENRQKAQNLFAEEGLAALQKAVEIADPLYYAQVDRQNPVRLMRALETFYQTGMPYSHFRQKERAENAPPLRPFEVEKIGLQWERSALYERINRRVEAMWVAGLVEEVAPLYPLRHLPALQTVGCTEIFEAIEGKHDFNTAKELIKQNTRRYAKRQETWFKREPNLQWIQLEKT